MSKTKLKTRKSNFSCHAPKAPAVFLAGIFNDWRADATPMEKNSEGEWTTPLDLQPGRHEFKFVVDGEWVCEPGCRASIGCPECVPKEAVP